MSEGPKGGWRALMRFELLSPRGFLTTAAMLAVLFGICHVAGLREYASVLCGQLPEGNELAVPFGAIYVLFYFAFVLLAPVLVLGAAVFAALLHGLSRRAGATPSDARQADA